jgi:hypothetical protein
LRGDKARRREVNGTPPRTARVIGGGGAATAACAPRDRGGGWVGVRQCA